MRGKWVRTIVYLSFIALLWKCTGCALLPDEKPPAPVISCDQASVDRQIMVASKAGCKRYKIEKDEMFQTCSFVCFESKP